MRLFTFHPKIRKFVFAVSTAIHLFIFSVVYATIAGLSEVLRLATVGTAYFRGPAMICGPFRVRFLPISLLWSAVFEGVMALSGAQSMCHVAKPRPPLTPDTWLKLTDIKTAARKSPGEHGPDKGYLSPS